MISELSSSKWLLNSFLLLVSFDSPIEGNIGSGISPLVSSSDEASWCGTKLLKLDFWRVTVDGNSVKRNDSCLLKGELTWNTNLESILKFDLYYKFKLLYVSQAKSKFTWFSCPNPLKEVWRWYIKSVAWGRAMAYGLDTFSFSTGGSFGLGFRTWGSWSLSVMVACLNDPRRVKLELDESKFIETVHSLSRFCLRSKHMANAHPTAWLNRSPCNKDILGKRK